MTMLEMLQLVIAWYDYGDLESFKKRYPEAPDAWPAMPTCWSTVTKSIHMPMEMQQYYTITLKESVHDAEQGGADA